MTFALKNNGSDERYRPPDPFAVAAPILPKVDDPTEFLKEYNELLRLNREVQQSKAETEAEACKRLIAITLEYAKKRGLSPNDLPNLKRKSYDQLCEYIKKSWPELIASV